MYFLLVVVVFLGVESASARYASIVIEADSGRVLHSTNSDTRNFPASLTKMMTLYLTFEALERGDLSLDDKMSVSLRASGMAPSKLGLGRGSRIGVEDAIYALVTKSANDVAVVLAERLGGTEIEFARLMTERARSLGMSSTTFRNASGLPNRGQLSTAHDMARLSQALLSDYPGYYHYFRTRSFRWGGRTYRNHNRLLEKLAGTDGLKTGYIRASGFNVAASTERDGVRLITVVFGGQTGASRDSHAVSLTEKAFARLRSEGALVSAGNGEKTSRALALVSAARASVGGGADVGGGVEVKAKADGVAAGITETTGGDGMLASLLVGVSKEWGIQVGAFSTQARAEGALGLALSGAGDYLRGNRIVLQEVVGLGKTILRAQFLDLSKDDAILVCNRLRATVGLDCLIVHSGTAR
ncbi:MAG: D-alanyl-D-alanine carboxypeptidase [Alphaproteobacteria bacterium]